MKTSAALNTMSMAVATLCLLSVSVFAAPMESQEDRADNSLAGHPDNEVGLSAPWDDIDADALRKMFAPLDTEDRMTRVSRSQPWQLFSVGQMKNPAWTRMWRPHSWPAGAASEGRLEPQWRAAKRQVRFRQCYFNPISCFRK